MKKLAAILLMSCLTLAMTACGNQQSGVNQTADNGANTNNTDTSEADTNETETSEQTGATEQTGTTEQTDTADSSETEEQSDDIDTATTLVVYFSSTGNTKAIAENIAGGLGADIYEIVAEDPYTEADLDYGDDNSRSTLEMNDSSVRPAIAGSVENMEQYDTVYIGYPIWWGEAPRIVDTFVESYDFTGKTVIPFCTSASSGMGGSASTLESLAGAGTWLDGQRFRGNESADEIMEWVNQF